ncbi:MAG: hypothetical protein H6512_06275 [Acidimicrobiia bacterium]|nr:hypothetical protein [Acidimicrobiia bacterium]
MKYLVLVPDGAADQPLSELGGRTPIEYASMPTFAKLASRAEVGRAAVIPRLSPGSDVGNMAIMGFDPSRYHTGRAPIDEVPPRSRAMGIDLADDEVAYRCNLVTVVDGVMQPISRRAISRPNWRRPSSKRSMQNCQVTEFGLFPG